MDLVATSQIVQPTAPTVVQQFPISFDNRYMVTGFVNASLIPGTPFVNMWGNVTVSSLLVTDKKGVTTRIPRELQSLNQDNVSLAYDQATLDSVLALLRICRWPSISPYRAFLADANLLFPCTVTNLETNQWVSQPIEIDLDHTIFTTQYVNWHIHQLQYVGYDIPQAGDVWSGGLVLGLSGTTIDLAEYFTNDVMFGDVDPFSPTYIEKLSVLLPVPGYQYLRAAGYKTPFVRADLPYTLEWLNDSPNVVATQLYCRDLCCASCDGIYYGSFAPSGSLEVDGHPVGTQRLWLIKGVNNLGSVITQMWFSAVATCPRKLTYFGEFIEDCKLPPSPIPPVPTPSALPPPPSPSVSPSPSPSLSVSSWASPSLSRSPSPSPSPSQSLLSPSPSPSQSLLSPSPSQSLLSPSPSQSLLSPSPSQSLLSPSPSQSLLSPSPSQSLSPSLSPSPSPEPDTGGIQPCVSDTIDGRFVITWVSGNHIVAQCFSSANVATTPIVPIDDGDTNSHPCVAIAPDGTFVVTYLSNLVPSTESNIGLEIRARMFSAAGAPLGTSFVVNAEPYIPPWQTVNTFGRSRIGMRSDKTFVIVWSEWTNATNAFFIYGQRFDAAGVKVWPVNFLISGDASVLVPPNKHDPDVDIADNGDFVVVWDSEDAGTHAAYGRRYNAAGTAYAPEFKINQTTHTMSNVGVYPRVSVAANGLFVAVWHRFPAPALNAFGVFARRYNASGVAQGGEFQVNTTLNSLYRWYPDVACDRDGNFTVVWQSFDNPDNPYTQDNGIIARQYNAAGTATTGEYVVNNPTLSASLGIGDQISPAVTRKAGSGAWVTAWEGLQGVPPSGGVYNIWHSQIIGNPLPITSWTLTAPISGSYPHGTLLTVQWVAYGVQAGNNINLCYITTIDWSGTSHWVKFGGAISNGAGYWNWDTTGVPPGTYYIAGYIWNGAPVYAHATTTFIIT